MKKWILGGGVTLAGIAVLGLGGYVALQALSGLVADARSGDTPPARVESATPVPVERRDITSTLVLDATVERDPAVEVPARRGGTVSRVWVGDGHAVDQGAPIVTLRSPVAEDSSESGQESREETFTVRATGRGVVSGMAGVMEGTPVERGEVVARVRPESYRAVAAVAANDLYRFYERPTGIELRIDRGPPAEPCEFLSLGEMTEESIAPPAGRDSPRRQGTGPEGWMRDPRSGSGSRVELACRVPADLTVFSGVQGELSVRTGEATDVPTVPITAVRGGAERGEVLVVAEDGTHETREVELGVSDGSSIEIVSGLEEGEEVVDPVPLTEEFDAPSAPDRSGTF